jgi:hypothetical protein
VQQRQMDLSLCDEVLWKVRKDECSEAAPALYPISDKILCYENQRIVRTQAMLNARNTCPQWHDLSEEKDFEAEGNLIKARRAGCGDYRMRSNTGPEGGWLMSVCPTPTYSNNVTAGVSGSVCAPRHQAFMNQTRRGTGTLWTGKKLDTTCKEC